MLWSVFPRFSRILVQTSKGSLGVHCLVNVAMTEDVSSEGSAQVFAVPAFSLGCSMLNLWDWGSPDFAGNQRRCDCGLDSAMIACTPIGCDQFYN